MAVPWFTFCATKKKLTLSAITTSSTTAIPSGFAKPLLVLKKNLSLIFFVTKITLSLGTTLALSYFSFKIYFVNKISSYIIPYRSLAP